MMRHAMVSLLILFSLLLPSCTDSRPPVESGTPTPVQGASPRIGPALFDGLNAREALALANKWGTTTPEVQSFVDTEAVKVTFKKSGKTVEIPLPNDQLVVAFAPYISKTHPCQIHYMSGCQGELIETTVKVTATAADGTILLDEEITTMKNGFLELWLPRNQEIMVTREALGRNAEGRIGTFPRSTTCITTFQLPYPD